MDSDAAGLPVAPLQVLRQRRSAKWQNYDADVLPLTVAEMDFALAEPVADVLRQAVAASDTGYAQRRPGPWPGDRGLRRAPLELGPQPVTGDRGDGRRGGCGRITAGPDPAWATRW